MLKYSFFLNKLVFLTAATVRDLLSNSSVIFVIHIFDLASVLHHFLTQPSAFTQTLPRHPFIYPDGHWHMKALDCTPL